MEGIVLHSFACFQPCVNKTILNTTEKKDFLNCFFLMAFSVLKYICYLFKNCILKKIKFSSFSTHDRTFTSAEISNIRKYECLQTYA